MSLTDPAFCKGAILRGHVDEATAYVVDDYPYGFRLRTQIRYWIETTKHGDRFVSQTLNPKTDRWNKPKKSTYTDVGAMYLDAEEHVVWTGIGIYSDDDAIDGFMSVVGTDNLSDAQKGKLAGLIGTRRAYKDVTWSIHEGPMTPEDDAEQAKIHRFIGRKVAIESVKALRELES